MVASTSGILYIYGWRRVELLILTWWPMLLGWLGACGAVATGLLAQAGLPPQSPYRDILNWHIGTGIGLAVVYGGLLYVRWLRRARPNRRRSNHSAPTTQELLADPQARVWVALALLLGLALVVVTGWNGGRLVYEWGINVLRHTGSY